MTPFEVISEPRRREILARLGELGESPVGALAELIDISRPAVSQHLKVLKDAGMVDERQDGRQRLYRLNAEGIANIEAEGYKKLKALGATTPTKIFTAGGGSKNQAWTKIRAQITGHPVVAATNTEACYGSALLAKKAVNNE